MIRDCTYCWPDKPGWNATQPVRRLWWWFHVRTPKHWRKVAVWAVEAQQYNPDRRR